MKRFAAHIRLDEISKAGISKGTAPTKDTASRYIARTIDDNTTDWDSRGNKKKRKANDPGGRLVRMGQIGDEYAVWENVSYGKSKSGAPTEIEYFVVHRPTNRVAAVLNTIPTVGDKKTKEVNLYVEMLSVDPKLRKSKIGFSLPQALYKFLNTAGYRIQSGKSQSEGGKSVWKGLISDPELLQRTFVKYRDNGGMENYTPDKEHKVWVDAELDDLYMSHSKARGQYYDAHTAIGKAQDQLKSGKTQKQKDSAKAKLEKAKARAAKAKAKEQEIDTQIKGSESTLVIKPKGKAVTQRDLLKKSKSSVDAPTRAPQQFKPGTMWKTPAGKWGAKRKDGTVDYFDTDRAARAWINPKA